MAELGRDAADRSLAEVLLNESPDALFALSFEGKVLSWNHGATVMFGFGSDEAGVVRYTLNGTAPTFGAAGSSALQ